MICENCGGEFKPIRHNQKFCSRKCRERFHFDPSTFTPQNTNPEEIPTCKQKIKALPKKTLAEWLSEAAACNLDYGTYRALISAGKTFDELKATADTRQPPLCSNAPSHYSGLGGSKL